MISTSLPNSSMAVCRNCRNSSRKLEKEEHAEDRLLKEEVDEDDIAKVVSTWTGIPVSRLMEGEKKKLAHLDEILHQRVIGQDEL